MRWKTLGYAAAVLYNAALWVLWSRLGWKLSTHPQFFLVPVGLSTILFAEVNRRELGRANVNTIRTVGLTIIYLSLAVPIWQYESFGAWVALLIGSLVGIFLGIGLRLQTFLWMGLTTFVLDVIYEMGRVSLDYALAKWAIMLALGMRSGDVRGAQREKADRRHDAALFRPGKAVGMMQSSDGRIRLTTHGFRASLTPIIVPPINYVRIRFRLLVSVP